MMEYKAKFITYLEDNGYDANDPDFDEPYHKMLAQFNALMEEEDTTKEELEAVDDKIYNYLVDEYDIEQMIDEEKIALKEKADKEEALKEHAQEKAERAKREAQRKAEEAEGAKREAARLAQEKAEREAKNTKIKDSASDRKKAEEDKKKEAEEAENKKKEHFKDKKFKSKEELVEYLLDKGTVGYNELIALAKQYQIEGLEPNDRLNYTWDILRFDQVWMTVDYEVSKA